MFKNSIKLMSLVLLAALVVFSSCKKEDDDPPPVVVLDGIYVYGIAAPYTGFDTKGIMTVARNEVTQEDRATLYEIFLPLKGGQDFNIVKVAGAVQSVLWSRCRLGNCC